jgi:hypothetical protein
MCFGEGERRADRVRGKFGKTFVKSVKDDVKLDLRVGRLGRLNRFVLPH